MTTQLLEQSRLTGNSTSRLIMTLWGHTINFLPSNGSMSFINESISFTIFSIGYALILYIAKKLMIATTQHCDRR